MEETRTICDVKGCKNANATKFSFFKERKSDGAGSMENWYYTFDLCSDHQNVFLRRLLLHVDDAQRELYLGLLDTLNITPRSE